MKFIKFCYIPTMHFSNLSKMRIRISKYFYWLSRNKKCRMPRSQ